MVLAGVAVHLGYLSLGWVITCGFLGTLFGDQLYFFLGRRHGTKFLARYPSWQQRSQRVYRIMERYPNLLILGCRFLYGIRTVTPFAIGMSNVSYLRFTLLNIIMGYYDCRKLNIKADRTFGYFAYELIAIIGPK